MEKVVVTPDNISELVDSLKSLIENSDSVIFGDFFSPNSLEYIEKIIQRRLVGKTIPKNEINVSLVTNSFFEESRPRIFFFHSEGTIDYQSIVAELNSSIIMDNDKIIVISVDQKWGIFIKLIHLN
ncbi:hypothetical protein GW758_04130 [Candidatus Falkowbacteria bacterium]|nr:hypothetical protein [Candidatus Falkowbacteria bacterium]